MNDVFSLQPMRLFFNSGATQNVTFRKEQLQKLKDTILKYEEELYVALHKDLRKSKEEAWATEIGLVIAEIKYFLKNINQLVAPKKVSTNLLNQPGKSYISREPLGVVLIIAPWNYPVQLLLIPLIGAIAAGNCVVLKPSEVATATEQLLHKIITETFLPQYINIITGNGATVIPALLNQFKFDHIFYTGSTAVGKSIYQLAAQQLTPVTLELGGKSPCVVSKNANLQLAAKRIAFGKFLNAGQTCIAPDYILVHQSVKENLMLQLKQAIKKFYGEQPAQSYDYGRIINEKQFNRLLGYMQQSTIWFGGDYNKETLYIAPTLIDMPNTNDAMMQEEIFGPILPILTYDDDETALQIISQNPNPLAFYIFTNNDKEADEWIEKVPSGGACVNAVAMHYINKNLPFGGRGNSGIGHYHGQFSIQTFSHEKAVLKAPKWPDFSIAYPSFKGKLSLLKKIIG